MTDLATIGFRADTRELETAEGRLRSLETQGASTEKAVDNLNQGFSATATVSRALTGAIAGLVAGMSVQQVIAYADEWQNAGNKLRTVTSSSQELAATQQELMGVANSTRTAFSATADLYTTLSRSTGDLNLSQQDLLDITTTVNQTFAIAGASAAEADGAIRQLSQGLAAGSLRGDEFNSIAEQAPGILDAVATSLNMSRGELRDYAAEGKITAEVVVKALQQSADSIGTTFAASVSTFSQSMTVAQNNMLAFVGNSDLVKSSTSAIGNVVVALSENLNTVATVAEVVAAVLAARMVPSLIATATQIGVAATAAISGATAMGTLNAAMALLGGPAGVITLAAGAAYLWFQRADEAYQPTVDLSKGVDQLSDSFKKMGTAQRELELLNINKDIAETNSQYLMQQSVVTNLSARVEEFVKKYPGATADIARYNGKLLEERAELERLGEQLTLQVQTRTEYTEVVDDNTAASERHSTATEVETGLTSDLAEAVAAAAAELRGQKQATDDLNGSSQSQISNTDFLNELYRTQAGNVAVTADAYLRMMGITDDTAVSVGALGTGIEGLGSTNSTVMDAMDLDWQNFRNSTSDFFADLMMEGGNAWDNLAKSAERAIYKMVGDVATSGLLSLLTGEKFDLGTVLGNSGTGGKVLGGVLDILGLGAGGKGKGKDAGGGLLGGLGSIFGGGKAAKDAADAVASGGGLSGMLGGIGSSISGMLGGLGSAIAGAGSAVTSALAAIPGWGWALAGAGALVSQLDKSTPSYNAGILLHDVAGVTADRKFGVEQFDSGLTPVGFNRRTTEAEASKVVDSIRAYDTAVTELRKKAGIEGDVGELMTALSGIGLDEKGQGSGVFLGVAGESGGGQGKPLQAQINDYVRAYFSTFTDELSDEVAQYIMGGSTADEMIARASERIGIPEPQEDAESAAKSEQDRAQDLAMQEKMLDALTNMSSTLQGLATAIANNQTTTQDSAGAFADVVAEFGAVVQGLQRSYRPEVT